MNSKHNVEIVKILTDPFLAQIGKSLNYQMSNYPTDETEIILPTKYNEEF